MGIKRKQYLCGVRCGHSFSVELMKREFVCDSVVIRITLRCALCGFEYSTNGRHITAAEGEAIKWFVRLCAIPEGPPEYTKTVCNPRVDGGTFIVNSDSPTHRRPKPPPPPPPPKKK